MENQNTSLIDLRCGSCQKSSDQKVVAEYKHVIGQEEEFDGQPFYNEEEWLLRISLCQLCNTVNLSVEAIDGGEVTLLYPTPLPDLEGLPENIARAYKAARAVKPIDANAFAVLLRRLLEFVCIDRNATGDTLFKQLKDLANRGEIPGPLADMADQLRTLGNIGAHASLGELSSAEVPILDDLCRAILEYVYSAPHRVAKVSRRIDELKNRRRVP
ncbi:MAG: DUF4145 domain-containing protein [Pyrinomonadaceae bacterium]|nr:DUF4145 domain-containing protein [Pyrinomonadaceae bacterium]